MKLSRLFFVFLLLLPVLAAAQATKTSSQRTNTAKSAAPAAPKPIPPFDKLELFAFLAAGPFPPYAAEVIHQRGLDFAPNDPFLLSYPYDPVREALAHVTPVKAKPMSPKRVQAFTRFSEAADSIRDHKCALAELDLQAAIHLAPDSASLHFAAAACRMISHNWPEAEKEMRESLRLWPGNADAHGLLAYLLSNQGRDQEAIPEAREALRIFPKHQGTIMVLGLTLARAAQYDQAIPILQQSAELNQKVTYVEKMLGFCFLSTNRAAEAIDPLSLYLQADPSDAESHFLLGTALKAVGRDDEAQSQFDEAARLDPENQRYQSAAHPANTP